MEKNTCFVAMPIGKKDIKYQLWKEDGYKESVSEFEHWRNVYENIIKQSIINCNHNIACARADDHREPGMINEDILRHLRDDFICIFDVTGRNPNVFYELGIRDCWSNRNIIVASDLKNLPFDIFGQRALQYEVNDNIALTQFSGDMKYAINDLIAFPQKSRNSVQKYMENIINHRAENSEEGNKSLVAEEKQLLGFETRLKNLLKLMQISVFSRAQCGEFEMCQFHSRDDSFSKASKNPYTIAFMYPTLKKCPDWSHVKVESKVIYRKLKNSKYFHITFIFPINDLIEDRANIEISLESFINRLDPEDRGKVIHNAISGRGAEHTIVVKVEIWDNFVLEILEKEYGLV